MTQEIVEWKQTNISEFIEEKVHNLDDAIRYGKMFVQVEEEVWKAIGYLALHIEKGEAGRGYEGGISEFARGIGRSHQIIFTWMSAVRGKEIANNLQFSQELPQAHYQLIDKAEHPEPIIEVIAETIEETGKIPSIPHIARSTGVDEWFTPLEYIESARKTMGTIDIDPASCDIAQKNIKAAVYYTKETDGLDKQMVGNVWMNPPYSQPLVADFCEHFLSRYRLGEAKQACVLLNNNTETAHQQAMLSKCSAICVIRGRGKNWMTANGELSSSTPLNGHILYYFGDRIDEFTKEFSQYGVILYGAPR